MFSGIIEKTGTVKFLEKYDKGSRLSISTGFNSKLGESIAVNGVCLTVTKFSSDAVYFDLLQETLKRTKR